MKPDLDKYTPTIGIECHVQLKTDSKLFARVSNDARGAEPNTTVSPICFGLPGVLPYLNQGAVELAVRAGIALNAQINTFSKFDRKHYFYPDLPKGYQITQYDQPIVGEGYVEVEHDGQAVKIGIERAHMEEDAGKLTHPDGADYSLVDLNRAGTPLIEIVSRPDIHSPAVAKRYVRELYLLMKYAGVSDVDLYQGHMRFDINISVAPKGSAELGTRTEVKNLNSFKSVEKAAQYEFERQVELLAKGESIVQETRGWHDAKQKTFSQRGKEEAHDYRYFPEPDLPPIELDQAFIDDIRQSMPKSHRQIEADLIGLGVSLEAAQSLFEYPVLMDKLMAEQEAGADESDMKRIANWLSNVVVGELSKHPDLDTQNSDNFFKYPGHLTKLSKMVEDGSINSSAAKGLLIGHFTDFIDPMKLAEEAGLLQTTDDAEIEKIVDKVLSDNPKAADDVKSGQVQAIGFLVGQVMKASGGKVNPKTAQDILKRRLNH